MSSSDTDVIMQWDQEDSGSPLVASARRPLELRAALENWCTRFGARCPFRPESYEEILDALR